MRHDPSIEIEECDSVYRPDDDTFLLLDCLRVVKGERMLEMGCGSGILSIHCARAGGVVTAVDLSPQAVECTRRNARNNGAEIEVFQSDLFSMVNGVFDLIVFNPPYLPVKEEGELESAWSGGYGGIEVVGRFLDDVRPYMAVDGRVTLLLSTKMDQEVLSDRLNGFMIRTLVRRSFFFEELRVVLLER
jgi:release factor glutamine methyltransferase